ncbi:hypothetical protein NQ318_003882 [Aromia moschata]|uniref:Reverse transcriptase domain-containing protein n=1 Tax=Aromia moschata TaxID=1265417 RepID=A0AAV8ZA06_9CUCU|nr:hypothetical protein NQ318_003882 [Aromia moschata]
MSHLRLIMVNTFNNMKERQWVTPCHLSIKTAFMSRFETEAKDKFEYFPRVWFRYVDDIFAVFDTKAISLDNFVAKLNNSFPTLKFIYEMEHNEQLSFLDVIVMRNSENKKETATSRYIPNDSHHPFHKMASFNFLIYRLLNFPQSKNRFEHEKKLIKNIAKNYGYSVHLIDTLIRKHTFKRTLYNSTTFRIDTDNSQFVSLPYEPKFTRGLDKMTKYDISPIDMYETESVKKGPVKSVTLRSGFYTFVDKEIAASSRKRITFNPVPFSSSFIHISDDENVYNKNWSPRALSKLRPAKLNGNLLIVYTYQIANAFISKTSFRSKIWRGVSAYYNFIRKDIIKRVRAGNSRISTLRRTCPLVECLLEADAAPLLSHSWESRNLFTFKEHNLVNIQYSVHRLSDCSISPHPPRSLYRGKDLNLGRTDPTTPTTRPHYDILAVLLAILPSHAIDRWPIKK